MVEMQFHEEDDEGRPLTYTDWQELATASPGAVLKVDTLSEEQVQFLIAELTPYLTTETFRNYEEKIALPDFQEYGALSEFAWTNLPLLKGEYTDPLMDAVSEAKAFLGEELKGVVRGSGAATMVARDGKGWRIQSPVPRSQRTEQDLNCYRAGRREGDSDDDWREVRRRAGQVAGTSLFGLYNRAQLHGIAPLKPLWLAVGILVYASKCYSAIEAGNAKRAAAHGVWIGTLRHALEDNIKKGKSRSKGGATSAENTILDGKHRERDAYIVEAVSKEMAKGKTLTSASKDVATDLARLAESKGWKPVGNKQIREIYKKLVT